MMFSSRAVLGPALLALLWWGPSSLAAQGLSSSFGFGSDAEPRASIESVTFDADHYEQGQTVRGAVRISIQDGWHINSVTPNLEFSIPTRLTLDSAALQDVKVEFPPHIEQTFSFAGGEKLSVYEGDLVAIFSATRTASADRTVNARLYFQACDDSVCLPPAEHVFSAELGTPVGDVPAQPQSLSPHSGAGEAASTPAAGFTPLSEAEAQAEANRPSMFSGDVGGTLTAYGLPITLGAVLLLGLALNLTPCVYPLIPITLGYFASQSGAKRSTRAGLAITYVLGIAATYSTLGVVSALSGSLFGGWLQSPWVLGAFAALMVALAASMFGFWEIRVPHFISDRAGARSGWPGALTMGLLAGIVAAPCVGPVVISLIALVSESQDPVLGFALFFALAVGLGLPYLVLGIFSSGVAQIPRSGPWMVQIKKALGFVLIAMAFYFLRPLTGDEVFRWGVAISLLVGAGFLAMSRTGPAGRVVRWIAAVLLLAAGLWFALDRGPGAGIEWVPYSEERLAMARRDGKPVVIDFYADWCLPCKELDRNTFTDAAVISEADRFVRLKADLTRTTDPETVQLTEQYGIVGVPTIVFVKADGSEAENLRLTGYEPAPPFLGRLEQVR